MVTYSINTIIIVIHNLFFTLFFGQVFTRALYKANRWSNFEHPESEEGAQQKGFAESPLQYRGMQRLLSKVKGMNEKVKAREEKKDEERLRKEQVKATFVICKDECQCSGDKCDVSGLKQSPIYMQERPQDTMWKGIVFGRWEEASNITACL